MSNFKRIKEFHRAMQHETRVNPGFPSTDRIALREAMIDEEYKELKIEIEYPTSTRSLEKVVKEACDLLYVVYGLLDELGVDADAAFAEVHRSNMSKLGNDGKPIRREDGKVLKGPNFSPADMSKVCDPCS